ncbi:MAG: ubiquitin carboxyl-terminal hydrolase, partial [Oscillospiraceae bacterium]|nr:ubiquitin carboxyl-terminal hydrolase [Oscillospiraceae bacterium]
KQLTPNQTIKFVNNDLIPLAKEYGYNFNLKDYLNLIKKENTAKLSKEELLSAAGGGKFSLKALSLAGAIILSGASSLANANFNKSSSKSERAILSNANSRRHMVKKASISNQDAITKARNNQNKKGSKSKQSFKKPIIKSLKPKKVERKTPKTSSSLSVSLLPIGVDVSNISPTLSVVEPSCVLATIQSIVRSLPKEKLLIYANKLSKKPDNFSNSFGKLIKGLLENNTRLANNNANKFILEINKMFKDKNNENYTKYTVIIDPKATKNKINCEMYYIFLTKFFNLNKETANCFHTLDVSTINQNKHFTNKGYFCPYYLNNNNSTNIQEALKHLFEKKVILDRPNSILISTFGNSIRQQKNLIINEKINLTEFDINGKTLKYNLKSFVCKNIRAPNHYYTYVKINEKWFKFDGSKVEYITKIDALNAARENVQYYMYEKEKQV